MWRARRDGVWVSIALARRLRSGSSTKLSRRTAAACARASQADSSAGRARRASRTRSPAVAKLARTTSSLVGKCRKKLLRETPALSAIWSAVVSSNPWARNNSMAARVISARTAARWRSRRESLGVVLGVVGFARFACMRSG